MPLYGSKYVLTYTQQVSHDMMGDGCCKKVLVIDLQPLQASVVKRNQED